MDWKSKRILHYMEILLDASLREKYTNKTWHPVRKTTGYIDGKKKSPTTLYISDSVSGNGVAIYSGSRARTEEDRRHYYTEVVPKAGRVPWC